MCKPIDVLSRDEVLALVHALNPRYRSRARDRAWIALVYGTGLRCAEACDLLVQDLDLPRGAATVRRGKGGKRRLVGIPDWTRPYLELWLARRGPKPGPVFDTPTGLAVRPHYYRRLLPRLAAKIGLAKRVHPHGLRHSWASAAAWAGMPIHLIQAALGHANLAITTTYVQHLAPTSVIEAMRGFNP